MRVPTSILTEQELRDTLDLLYAESKEGKSFTGILELASCEQVINTAVHNIKANKGAKTPGVDGKTISYYLQMKRERLIGLVRHSLNNYQPKPVRRVHIPKRNGKLRPLGIPSMLDRIIQECLRIVLEPILEARFYDHSYGFRPYRATSHALAQAVDIVNKGYEWVIEGDIKGFFDNVDHSLLLAKLHKLGIIDKRILAIIHKMLMAGVLEAGVLSETAMGTPQGGILSPLLANAFLNDFDWFIARQWAEPKGWERYSGKTKGKAVGNYRRLLAGQGKPGMHLVRYADDWILFTESKEDAEHMLAVLGDYFKHRCKLELSAEKTLITNVTEQPAKFLSYCLARRPRALDPSGKLVAKLYPNPNRIKDQIRTLCDAVADLQQLPTWEARAAKIEVLNAKIMGIAEYWKFGQSKRVLGLLDHKVFEAARATWRHWYGRSGYSRFKVRVFRLNNLPQRHNPDGKNRLLSETWAVRVGDMLVGITRATLTEIQYSEKLKQGMTPYTPAGRKMKSEANPKRKNLLARPTLYDEPTILSSVNRKLYNFEYFLNREYAYNQTLWRSKGYFACQACKAPLVEGNRECHHKNPSLPLDKVNKVMNLVWLCGRCHHYVEHGIPTTVNLETTVRRKIEDLRAIKFGDKHDAVAPSRRKATVAVKQLRGSRAKAAP